MNSNPASDMPQQNEEPLFLKQRRHKFIGFMVCEALALLLLLVLGAFALSGRFGDPMVALSMNILTIAAAAAVILLPIVFFAIGPTLPRGDR